MTPQREAYLAKCSKLEMYLRNRLREAKITLKALKMLTGAPVNKEWLKMIKFVKLEINIIRHELNHLKGMDRVVAPKVEGNPPVYYCKCGHIVGFYEYGWFNEETYCSDCGRRVLWGDSK